MNRRLTAMADNNASTNSAAISVNPRDRPLALFMKCLSLLPVPKPDNRTPQTRDLLLITVLERQAAHADRSCQNRAPGFISVRRKRLSHDLNIHFVNLARRKRSRQRVRNIGAVRSVGSVAQVICDFQADDVVRHWRWRLPLTWRMRAAAAGRWRREGLQ